jgi:hypothetical protein
MATVPRASNGDDEVDHNKGDDNNKDITIARQNKDITIARQDDVKDDGKDNDKDDGKDDDRVVHDQTTKEGAVVSEKMQSSTGTYISLSTTTATTISTTTASATGFEIANDQKNASESNQIGDPKLKKENTDSGLSITVRIITSWICISWVRPDFAKEE